MRFKLVSESASGMASASISPPGATRNWVRFACVICADIPDPLFIPDKSAWPRFPQGFPHLLDQSLDGVADSPAAGIAGRVAAGAGWPGRTEILRFRRWAWICHLGPLSGASIG